jgi:hypothetical protein
MRRLQPKAVVDTEMMRVTATLRMTVIQPEQEPT